MKKFIAGLLMMLLIVSVMASPVFAKPKLNFKDVGEGFEWAKFAIDRMYEKGVIKGFPNGLFKPKDPVTHLQAIIMALRIMGWEKEVDFKAELPQKVKDIKLSWKEGYYYVAVAVEKGLVKSEELKNFRPNEPAKRHEVARYIVRAIGKESIAQSHMNDKLSFKDASAIPKDAVGYVYVITDLGLMKGYPGNLFMPNKPVTRAEMAVIINNLDGLIGDKDDDQKVTVTVKGIIVDVDKNAKTVTLYTYGKETNAYPGILKVSEIEGLHYELETTSGRYVLTGKTGGLDENISKSILVFGEVKDGPSIYMRGPVLEVKEWYLLNENNTLTFNLTENTSVKKDGKEVRLSELKEGSYVEIKAHDKNIISVEIIK
ncbi:S-layer homology domain-containing protein [Thermovenabulum gondwanense]|uniref:Endo-1,4-beta-xylanase A n=1 Tax=Thermovenabulum gondwanense TaxID=520767 RepID=A0A161PST6_9FIRM|nr:S-layer homology domain-containing protein [Thermovenabulum gondwanense]KYO64317.1 Endo-1,4-beta-xylanase A [Thermovenabulum gondwanense]